MTAGLRPRTAPELVDAAVAIVRREYFTLLSAFFLCLLAGGVVAGSTVFLETITSALGSPYITLPVFVLAIVAAIAMAQAMAVAIATEAYLGRHLTVMEAARRALRHFWPAVLLEQLKFIIIVLGFLCFIIPGIVFSLWFFGTMNVLMYENVGPVEALKRSRQIAKGSLGRIFRVFALFSLIGLVIRVLAAVMVAMVAGSQAANLISTCVGLLLYPFLVLTSTVMYFDLRVRKEGLDLELMAQDLGAGQEVAVNGVTVR
jgi:hypothetical protein